MINIENRYLFSNFTRKHINLNMSQNNIVKINKQKFIQGKYFTIMINSMKKCKVCLLASPYGKFSYSMKNSAYQYFYLRTEN